MPNKTAQTDRTEVESEKDGSDPHILICDDDAEIRRLLADFLEGQGYAVSTVADGRDLARRFPNIDDLDLAILDVMLPGKSGIEICRELRAVSNIPILMLTARGDETDRIVGLEIGADDYMSKPFGPNELLARIKALLRRARMAHSATPHNHSRVFEFEGWRLDPGRRELRNPNGVIIDLSAGEFDMLMAFLEAPQRVLTREQLLEAMGNKSTSVFDRSIDVQVSRLRRKIESSDDSEALVKTVRGAGYLFAAQVRRL